MHVWNMWETKTKRKRRNWSPTIQRRTYDKNKQTKCSVPQTGQNLSI